MAWAEGDKLSWCGWPEGRAHVADCELVSRATDAEYAKLVEKIVGMGGGRGGQMQRLYMP